MYFLFTMAENPLSAQCARKGPCTQESETLFWDDAKDCQESRLGRRLVEPDGIEPTTSCLQSMRSPN